MNVEFALPSFKHVAKYGCWLLSSARRGGREAGVREWGPTKK